MENIKLKVTSSDTLINFLRENLTNKSKNNIKTMIVNNQIYVNNKVQNNEYSRLETSPPTYQYRSISRLLLGQPVRYDDRTAQCTVLQRCHPCVHRRRQLYEARLHHRYKENQHTRFFCRKEQHIHRRGHHRSEKAAVHQEHRCFHPFPIQGIGRIGDAGSRHTPLYRYVFRSSSR